MASAAVLAGDGKGLRGPVAALHWGGRALNAPTALRCSRRAAPAATRANANVNVNVNVKVNADQATNDRKEPKAANAVASACPLSRPLGVLLGHLT